MRIKGGISTYEREAAEQGGDWILTLQQRKREQDAFREAGVPLGDDAAAAAPARAQPDEDSREDEEDRRPGDPEARAAA
ncbi:hypothetical protein [Chenggangzhangella methanolivorans]|uniref:Uncharacterized protein n=2 Tax=Chenggangzhangella methanolivorans TaxID=1437009 RepID=A0A9E6R941_9HYPH|nr:hypothetical protein [Chenggangzhangella methanolivorans]QZN99786.1 hypothetical protein K6K41_24505 [Chenggangzhangella methanolivorans]